MRGCAPPPRAEPCSIFDYFGVNVRNTPTVRLIDLYGMYRFKMPGAVTEESLLQFIDKYGRDKIKVWLRRHVRV